jgi:hypothetical protein
VDVWLGETPGSAQLEDSCEVCVALAEAEPVATGQLTAG